MFEADQRVAPEVWEGFTARHGIGDLVEGWVTGLVPFGAFVEVEGVHGLLPRSASPARPEVGSSIPVRIVTIDAELRRLRFATA